jgi:high-affinity K+ transport system ATPase subunit B
MTRGALATFSIANDVAKYFATIPVVAVLEIGQIFILRGGFCP